MKKKRAIFYICIAVAAVCAVILALMGVQRMRQNRLTKQAQEQAVVSEKTGIEEVDFAALQKINRDIYGWIYIPGTEVNYPILQSGEGKEEDYYLDHNLDTSFGKPGCIYTQKRNGRDFTDPNTVIYGHNMRDGSMFRTLHDYQDAEFFADHPMIYIRTPEKKMTYRVFAAYRYDNRLILEAYDDFADPEVFADYLEEILNQDTSICNINRDVPVTAEDRIITLETCIGNDDYRYIVQAVLTEED